MSRMDQQRGYYLHVVVRQEGSSDNGYKEWRTQGDLRIKMLELIGSDPGVVTGADVLMQGLTGSNTGALADADADVLMQRLTLS
jgi:hypothetical protein